MKKPMSDKGIKTIVCRQMITVDEKTENDLIRQGILIPTDKFVPFRNRRHARPVRFVNIDRLGPDDYDNFSMEV